jgi:hypothetical protein
MKKLLLLSGLLPALLFTSACEQPCSGLEDRNRGAIIGSYDFGTCFFYANSLQGEQLIRNAAEFSNFKQNFLKNCPDSGRLPAVDFSRHMLIGLNSQTTACNVAYDREIALDTAAKVYKYTVVVQRCGECGTKFREPNWVLGPQLPAGYRFEAVVRYE